MLSILHCLVFFISALLQESTDCDSDSDKEIDEVKQEVVPKGVGKELYNNLMSLLSNLRPHSFQVFLIRYYFMGVKSALVKPCVFTTI